MNLVFYLWGKPKYVAILIASMLINYCGARVVDWFIDNLGYRNWLKDIYAKMQYHVFDNIFDTDMYI